MLKNQELLQRGYMKLNEVDGEQADKVMNALKDISPDLGKYILAMAGDIYSRSQLDLQQRELITLASLATLGGCENQLKVHIHASLNVGLTKEQIVETFIHCAPYIGFPKTFNATFVAKEIFNEK